jgi:hypothetical protein
MEEIKDYKMEIAQTRKGCLGSSDGKLLAQVVMLGYVPKSAYKRLAIVKGFIPQEEIPESAAIKAGNKMEIALYDYLASQDPRYESNPMWISEKYSTPQCKLISHPDIVLVDSARKTIFVYEVKTTKYSIEDTRQTYKAQLFIHYMLGKEMAERMGKDWHVKVMLAHYSTDGLDLYDKNEFDTNRLTVREVKFTSLYFDIKKAMEIISKFLESFDSYYEGDEVDADLLPETIKTQFDVVADMLQEIKYRESKVDEFKKKLYAFMEEKDIKSIKNDVFSITRVDPTESKSFDHKKYLDDLAKEHPRRAKKLQAQYVKVTKRGGYVNIKVKEEK